MIIGPCTVVTGGPNPAVIDGAGVRVLGAHIAQIGPVGNLATSYPDETVWPARGRVLMPGFVNTHAHLSRHLARGLGLRKPAQWKRYERALSPEDVRWAAISALVEGVRHGVTTVCDFHRSGTFPDLSLCEVLDAARLVGVRVATCYGASEADAPAERRAAFEESLGFAKDVSRRREGRLKGMVGVQATSLDGVDVMIADAHEAAGDALPVHVDLALDLTPAERWRARTPWPEKRPASLWAHVDTAPKALLAAARERGDVLTVTGSAATAALVRETELAWGTDEGTLAPPVPDALHGWSMSAAGLMHYYRLFVHGARWASEHFGTGLGVISPGAPADLLLVDYRPATEFSSRTLLEHLWAGLLRAPVSGVMVSGDIVMDNGVVLTVDETEVSARARECARRVWARSG